MNLYWMPAVGLALAVSTGCDERPAFKETNVDPGITESASGGDETGQSKSGDGQNEGVKGSLGPDTDDEGAAFKLHKEIFPSHEVREAEGVFSYDERLAHDTITMAHQYSLSSREKKQIVRAFYNNTFTQGTRGTLASESFEQSVTRALDILIVIDNSKSMDEEQKNLAAKLAPLIQYINGADWQIGVVTTDSGDTCLRSLITKEDPNPEDAFYSAVVAGINGDGNERGIYQALRSLRGSCRGGPWIREKSSLAVLFVSDEDNCSDGRRCGSSRDDSPEGFIAELSKEREPGYNARVYGLIWHPNDEQSTCPTAYNQGHQYASLIDGFGGTWGSICDTDYTSTLKSMSQHISSVLSRSFTLKHRPEAGSIEVRVDGEILQTGFSQKGNALVFEEPPREGAQIAVRYRHGAVGMRDSFDLEAAPAEDTIKVFVNGQPRSDFFIAGRKIRFATMIAEGAKLEVRYYENRGLPKIFTFNKSLEDLTYEVKVNGQVAAHTVLDATRGRIEMAVPPQDGALVVLEYKVKGEPIYDYGLSHGAKSEEYSEIIDEQTQEPVGCALEQGRLVCDAEVFREGRRIQVTYTRAQRSFKVELGHQPLHNELKVWAGDQVCAREDLNLQGLLLDVAGCGFVEENHEISVHYTYIDKAFHQFTLLEPVDLMGKEYFWQVFVGEKETKEFMVEGQTIILTNPPAEPTQVRIVLASRPQ